MRSRLFLGLTFTGLVMLSAAPTADSASPTSGFTVFPSPSIPNGGYLTGVAAASPSDVWAIGHHAGSTPLVEHYNGHSWSVVAHPPLPHVVLHGISAHGSAAWMVGLCQVASGAYGCAARYTGSRWERVAIPTHFSYGAVYNTVLVFSDTNVVVGGEFGTKSELIRWNGTSWTRVHDVPYVGRTLGIAGTLSNHLFSAGFSAGVPHGTFEHQQANGAWRLSEAFAPDSYSIAMSASSAENAWVIGGWYDRAADQEVPVAMRWNGTTETPVSVPSSAGYQQLEGVVTTRPDDTWAVGSNNSASGTKTLIEHYTGGSSFTVLDSPNFASPYNQLLAITAVPGSESDLWAVGLGGDQPLILHHS